METVSNDITNTHITNSINNLSESSSNSTLNDVDGNILIKVKTLNDITYDFRVLPNISITELKSAVRNSTNVPEERQRLLYRGKLLKDGDFLSQYRVEDGHTLHMVARPINITNTSTSASSQSLSLDSSNQTANINNIPSGSRNNPPTIGLNDILPGGHSSSLDNRMEEIIASMASRTATFQALRSSVDTLRTRNPNSLARRAISSASSRRPSSLRLSSVFPVNSSNNNSNERNRYRGTLEHVVQSVQSIRTILSSRNQENTNSSPQEFFVGQWIDVKDTVNQWLEATILQISDTQLLIRYNGWPSRWDEWINRDSNRISPFRTRTFNSFQSEYACPTPNISSRDILSRDLPSIVTPIRNVNEYVTGVPRTRTSNGNSRTEERTREPRREFNINSTIIQTHEALQAIAPLLNSLAQACEAEQLEITSRREAAEVAAPAPAASSTSRENIINSGMQFINDDSDLNISLEDLDVAPRLQQEQTPPTVNTTPIQMQSETLPLPIASMESTRQQARDIAPLIDRLGRILLDMAPQIRAYGGENNNIQNESGSIESPPNSSGSTLGSGYSDMILTSSPPQSSHGNIDIHIHAIVTPLRPSTTENNNISIETPSITESSTEGSSSPAISTSNSTSISHTSIPISNNSNSTSSNPISTSNTSISTSNNSTSTTNTSISTSNNSTSTSISRRVNSTSTVPSISRNETSNRRNETSISRSNSITASYNATAAAIRNSYAERQRNRRTNASISNLINRFSQMTLPSSSSTTSSPSFASSPPPCNSSLASDLLSTPLSSSTTTSSFPTTPPFPLTPPFSSDDELEEINTEEESNGIYSNIYSMLLRTFNNYFFSSSNSSTSSSDVQSTRRPNQRRNKRRRAS